jgi:hypothetical protein
MFYQNELAVKNTADVTGGKPIAVLLQSISGVSAINPLVAFYDIHGGKREALFFYFVPDTTRDFPLDAILNYVLIKVLNVVVPQTSAPNDIQTLIGFGFAVTSLLTEPDINIPRYVFEDIFKTYSKSYSTTANCTYLTLQC